MIKASALQSPLKPLIIGVMLAASSPPSLAAEPPCPDGRYQGQPAPGQTRYIKDHYVWAVTREFARRFCMPDEFVVEDLKGAEAIAYRHKPGDGEVCEMRSGKEVCEPLPRSHWIELYVRSSANIPKYDPRVEYYVQDYPTSGSLIASNQNLRNNTAREKGLFTDPLGKSRPFGGVGKVADGKRTAFGYLARDGARTYQERAAALVERYYQKHWFEGIDLLAIEGWSTGNIAGSQFQEAKQGYSIGVRREVFEHGKLAYPDDFYHVIELPRRIWKVINTVDREGGDAFDKAVRNMAESLRHKADTNPPTQAVR